jgi:hypothetical protein
MGKGWRFSKAFGQAGRIPTFEGKNYVESRLMSAK